MEIYSIQIWLQMLRGVFDVSVDEEEVSFPVDILRHHLEAVEATRLNSVHFVGEGIIAERSKFAHLDHQLCSYIYAHFCLVCATL